MTCHFEGFVDISSIHIHDLYVCIAGACIHYSSPKDSRSSIHEQAMDTTKTSWEKKERGKSR